MGLYDFFRFFFFLKVMSALLDVPIFVYLLFHIISWTLLYLFLHLLRKIIRKLLNILLVNFIIDWQFIDLFITIHDYLLIHGLFGMTFLFDDNVLIWRRIFNLWLWLCFFNFWCLLNEIVCKDTPSISFHTNFCQYAFLCLGQWSKPNGLFELIEGQISCLFRLLDVFRKGMDKRGKHYEIIVLFLSQFYGFQAILIYQLDLENFISRF